jgi:hypothetical protein
MQQHKPQIVFLPYGETCATNVGSLDSTLSPFKFDIPHKYLAAEGRSSQQD